MPIPASPFIADDLIDADVALPAPAERFNLAEALQLWIDVTGVEPGLSGSFTYGDLNVKFLHQEIQDAIDLDPTEVTGRMLLSVVAQNYFEERRFTVDQLLNKPQQVQAYLEKTRQLATFLRGPEVAGVGAEFAGRVKEALRRYDALTPESLRIVEDCGSHGDRGVLAVLRRDALRTLENLSIHQFLDGDTEVPGITPVYGKFMYRWSNINSMLRAMTRSPSGVTVNMIQSSENPYGVHFVFAIRNGGRLFVFTDKEQTPHPLAEGMWNRPDKILAARASRNWFPYDVAGLKFNEEGRAYIETAEGTSLVEYDATATPVKALSDLSPPQIIWLTMMLDLIVEKFWRNEFKTPQISYTGEMLRVSTPLLEAAQSANLPVVLNEQTLLTVDPISLTDIHSDAISEEDVGAMPDQRNRWMEERYRHGVVETSVDMVRQAGESLLINYDDKQSPRLVLRSELNKTGLDIFERDRFELQNAAVDALDPTSFGTKDQLQKDRLFLARSNYARQINTLAAQEFDERHQAVQAWVKDRMLANLPNLEFLFLKDSMEVRTERRGQSFSHGAYGCRYFSERGTREFISRDAGDAIDRKYVSDIFSGGNIVAGRSPWKGNLPACHYSGSPSHWKIQLIPETAEQLAYLCGVQHHELPDVLQHWNLFYLSYGNSILNRVDPMLFQVENPWLRLHFKFVIFIGKRAMSALSERVGLRSDPPPAFAA